MPTTSTPRRARSVKATVAQKTTTGAVSTATTVAEVVCPAAPRRNVNNAASGHQTHGAVTPMTGAISSVSQLTNGGRSIAKGSVGSFATLPEYSAYLRTLAVHELRRHAVAEARIVPIDDSERLIRRLETAWTASAAKYVGRAAGAIPVRQLFTQEQIEAQAAIKNKLLRQ